MEIGLRPERCIRCGACYATCKHSAIVRENGSYVTQRDKCQRCGDCVDVCVAEARIAFGKEMNTEDVLAEIKKDVVFYLQSGGGATFSGGEPLMQHEFLCSLLSACRAERISTAVDTSGYAAPEILELVAAQTDLFLYDLKTLDDRVHQQYTGVSNRCILDNLRLLDEMKKPVIVRIPIIPGVNDDEESIHEIGSFVRQLPTVQEIHLLPYHQAGTEKYSRLGQPYAMASMLPPPKETVDAMADILRIHVSVVAIGG